VEKGNLEMVDLLLAEGADPNLVDLKGNSSLAVAIFRQSRRPEFIIRLLDAGADPNWENLYGQSAISLAQMYNLKDIQRILEASTKGKQDPK